MFKLEISHIKKNEIITEFCHDEYASASSFTHRESVLWQTSPLASCD